MSLKAQLETIWNRRGVENPGNINIWALEGERLSVKPGAKRRPAWHV